MGYPDNSPNSQLSIFCEYSPRPLKIPRGFLQSIVTIMGQKFYTLTKGDICLHLVLRDPPSPCLTGIG